MQDIWRRIEAQFQLHAPEELRRLSPGATEGRIADVESLVGRRLPEDIRQSYAIHDGAAGYIVPSGPELGEFDFLLDLETVARELSVWRELLEGGDFQDSVPESVIGPMKHVWWSMDWVPIVGEGTGDHLCIDLDPAEGGSVGQVFDFGHEYGPTRVFFPSFRAYLEQYAADLESGAIRFNAEEVVWVRAGHPAA